MIGILLIFGAGVWNFFVKHRWTDRIPRGWEWRNNFVGFSAFADPQTNRFPEKDPPAIYDRSMKIISNDSLSITIRDSYTIRDLATKGVVWEYILDARIDPRTGEHIDYRGDQFVFPRNVEKKTYRLRYNYAKSIPLSFEREELIEGLRVYLFSYTGAAEYTESYAGTDEYPGTKVSGGQEIRCSDDQFHLRLWVEPLTGETIRCEESCYSGDYIYDIATGNKLTPICRWGGVTTGDALIAGVERARSERMKYLWAGRYFPLALLTVGLALTIAALLKRRGAK